MANALTLAVVGANDVAKELGKKGTASDLTLFNDVHDDRALTLVEATQFPEKLAPLFQALAMSDRCLLVVAELSRSVGEAIAVVELSGLPTTVARGPAVGEAELARALKGSRLESAPHVELNGPALRAAFDGLSAPARDGPLRVPLDHAFPVKGVGAVALGLVRQGTLRAHEKLRLWPTTKIVEVRSLQVHDADRKDVSAGERVGVALRGVEADELERGQVLAPEGSLRADATVTGSALTRCRYYRGDAGPGAQVHLAVGLQVVPASIDRLDSDGVRVTADRPVVWEPGTPAYLLDLGVPAGPRLVGATTLTG